jgi:hypothetical protein
MLGKTHHASTNVLLILRFLLSICHSYRMRGSISRAQQLYQYGPTEKYGGVTGQDHSKVAFSTMISILILLLVVRQMLSSKLPEAISQSGHGETTTRTECSSSVTQTMV